jgi:hypothetical protein
MSIYIYIIGQLLVFVIGRVNGMHKLVKYTFSYKPTRGIAHKIWVEMIHKTKRSIINSQAKDAHIVCIQNSVKII